MTAGPLTPGEDVELEQSSPTTTSPSSVPYNETFENDLMKTILYPPATPTTPTRSPNLPQIAPTSLPLPLKSPLRTHPSPLPGIQLTHPHGSLHGGPGPSPQEIADFATRFISEHHITNEKELQKKVDEAVKQRMAELRDRMAKREEAVQANERVRKEIKNLELDREAEKRVEESVRREKERKRGRS
jgi:gas vesicle protein